MSSLDDRAPRGSVLWAGDQIRRILRRDRTAESKIGAKAGLPRSSARQAPRPDVASPAGPTLADAARSIEALLVSERTQREQLAQASDNDPLATWPTTRPPLAAIQVRGQDRWGKGVWGDPRRHPDGTQYRHEGVDLVAVPGTPIYAPMDGYFAIGDPYGADKKKRGKVSSVRLHGADNKILRLFYVEPDARLRPGSYVKAGTYLGKSQDLQNLYGGITDHVHVQMESSPKKRIDPTSWVNHWQSVSAREAEQRAAKRERIELWERPLPSEHGRR
jgi:hypothetical protein